MFFYKLYQNDKSQGYDGYINGILKEAPYGRALGKPQTHEKKKEKIWVTMRKDWEEIKLRYWKPRAMKCGKSVFNTRHRNHPPDTRVVDLTHEESRDTYQERCISYRAHAHHCWSKTFNPLIWKNTARADQNGQDLISRFRQLWSVQQGVCFSLKL